MIFHMFIDYSYSSSVNYLSIFFDHLLTSVFKKQIYRSFLWILDPRQPGIGYTCWKCLLPVVSSNFTLSFVIWKFKFLHTQILTFYCIVLALGSCMRKPLTPTNHTDNPLYFLQQFFFHIWFLHPLGIDFYYYVMLGSNFIFLHIYSIEPTPFIGKLVF